MQLIMPAIVHVSHFIIYFKMLLAHLFLMCHVVFLTNLVHLCRPTTRATFIYTMTYILFH